MKYWILVLFSLLIVGCNNDEENYLESIKILNRYPYHYEKCNIEDVSEDKTNSFHHKSFIINSEEEINQNIIIPYCSDSFRDNLSKIDFEKNSLILTSTLSYSPIYDVDYMFYYNKMSLQYNCFQQLYTTDIKTPESINEVNFIANAFLVKKLKEDSEILLTINIKRKETKD